MMWIRIMWITKHRDVILLLAVSSALCAQSNDVLVKSQSYSNKPEVRQIVDSSIAATERSWQRRLQYTYVERDENRRLDPEGRVKSVEVDVSKTILVNGIPFEQLVEHNGEPPPATEERKQKEKLERLRRETSEERAERLLNEKEETTSLVREVPKAFDFQLVGEEIVDGRQAYVLQATPHPGYQPQAKYGKMFSKLEGKLWVDKQDLGWIKADGEVIQPCSIGLFLARVLRGSHITLEQTRVDGGIRMPQHIEIRAAAKIFLIKSLVIDRVLSYSDYRLAEAGVSAAGASMAP
jgi:hypothetical protein